MHKLLVVGASALALSLSGCGSLTAFNKALLPTLKPIDARIHQDETCGDLARKVMGVTAENKLTADQALAIVEFCEKRDASSTLTLDPQGARQVLDKALSNPAAAALPSPGG